MSTEKDRREVQKLLEKHSQGHLLAFWDELGPAERRRLLDQIKQLDLAEIDKWTATIVKGAAPAKMPREFGPAPSYPPVPVDREQQKKYSEATACGRRLISEGKVAAFVVAGGQGTRLGFDGPKGNFPVSPVRGRTLFQIFADTIAATSARYRAVCPWYVMTSPANHTETVRIFERNGYYGLDRRNVFMFQQGTLPNFGFDGRVLLAGESTIACSPDGHGGSLKALYRGGALEDMKKRGIEVMSYFQVDNPLVNVFDPLFIGLHVLDQAEMSSKALVKVCPKEKVGNFCLVDGRVTVIEYSDLPDELAERHNPDGSAVFSLGNPAIHVINRTFVEKLNSEGFSLPLHRAVKKIPHIDGAGRYIEPQEPNGVKLESFVFDALPLASRSVILETLREQEFAPVKNATGVDSAETARQLMLARAADWLESAGVAVPRKDDGTADCRIEIAPSFALEPDDVKEQLEQVPQIRPGDEVYLA
jgi:UDP-N-acetylglucosamine/UDP-N-acetylgalactosamine diphosphorylase